MGDDSGCAARFGAIAGKSAGAFAEAGKLERMRKITLALAILAAAPAFAAPTSDADARTAAAAKPVAKDAKPAAQQAVADAPRPVDPPLPEKAQPPDEPPPTVSIRNVKGAVIEEYRQGTRLYMIRVVPERGIAYSYMDTDGNGRLEYEGEDGPVRPVYYTLYEWD